MKKVVVTMTLVLFVMIGVRFVRDFWKYDFHPSEYSDVEEYFEAVNDWYDFRGITNAAEKGTLKTVFHTETNCTTGTVIKYVLFVDVEEQKQNPLGRLYLEQIEEPIDVYVIEK